MPVAARLTRRLTRRLAAVALAITGAAALPLATSDARHVVQAPNESARAAAPDPALVAEVRALNAAMTAAFERGDLRAVARFYADDARIVGPGRKTVRGRAAIDQYWAGIRGGRSWRLEVVEVGGSRDEAYEVGVSSLTTAGAGGRDETYTCDFVVIWRRQADGTLKITLDLYT